MTVVTGDKVDPKGLIREAYRIEGISEAECRSILMDWALSLPEGQGQQAALKVLLQRHGAAEPAHPMTALMTEGVATVSRGGRRGGWRGRRGA
ncbi:MAG: hypothetical protein GYB53_23800 [Rhodobacteraceae bacterium]|nr:hypothetical protein [Paracoccaceae bacterium]MBR9822245.1 hypothetical protein [Paracoccaceae bacterium]